MKLKDIYGLVIEKGLGKDPRSKAEIKKALASVRESFNKLKGVDRETFDKESLVHPYSDTRLLYGDPKTDVRKIMVGIDIEAAELLAADRLNQRGEGINLVMSHHPEGIAQSGFYKVMYMQEDMLVKAGIAKGPAKALTEERIEEVKRRVAPANHMRNVDLARLLNIPFMCVHTPADNHVGRYLERLFEREKPKRLSDILKLLKEIPEFKIAMRQKAGPWILLGSPEKKVGKIFMEMTGGTGGSKRIFPRLSQAGVGTIVAMHLGEDHFKMAKDEHVNIIITGHIASDSLGLNLLLDELVRRDGVEIVPCSGFIRIDRVR